MTAAFPDGVTATGTGRVSAPPDLVRLHLAAEATSGDVAAAFEAASDGLDRLRRALLDGGVAAADLQTTETSLWSETPVRHTARLGLVATVRDIAAAGRLLSASLAAAGEAARSSGLSFGHADPAALRAAARDVAYADARATAEQVAALAGKALGPVRWVVDGAAAGAPVPVGTRDVAFAAAEVAVDPGSLEVAAAVTVHWDWA